LYQDILLKNYKAMFGDMMGNLKKQQDEMKEKLSQITVEAESGDGAVKVIASANRKILDILIDEKKVDLKDVAMVQDLVLVAVNKALDLAAEREQSEAQKMLQDLMPPGLGNLSGLFG
jgi:nucleoid-associated protein EbfC